MTCSAKAAPSGKKRKPLSSPPLHALAKMQLPASKEQSTTLRQPNRRKGTDGSVVEYCCLTCATGAMSDVRASAGKKWAEFVESTGSVPRSDRRCLILAGELLAHAVVGGTATEGVRHLQSAPIWDLCGDDDAARTGLRKAIDAAWPKLQSALVAAFSATRVKATSDVKPHAPKYYSACGGGGKRAASSAASASAPVAGLATLEGYAALCGAVQLNCLTVKVPSPITRYIVGTPAAHAAPHPLAPAVQWLADEQAERVARRVEEEESILNDGDGDDDEEEEEREEEEEDSDSDDDDEGDFGDEVAEYTWGGDLTFDTSLFPAMKGAAVYPLVSSLNHSCAPNCEVAYIDDSKVIVVVKRDVKPGEELTISYVDTELSQAQREEELREVYGFVCKCRRCTGGKEKASVGKSPAKRKSTAAADAGVGSKRKATDNDDEGGKKKAKKGEGNGCVVC